MKKAICLFSMIIFLSACDDYPEPEVEYTSTFPVSGEWWVTYKLETEPGVFVDLLGSYQKLLTYNTAANTPDSLWIDDVGHFWDFKCKAAADIPNRSFATEESDNVSYESKVRIINGKVILDGGRSTSGVVTDSIYFEVLFDDDSTPFGTTYIVSGVRRTGFLEDEHD
jgi:hypothetical protein